MNIYSHSTIYGSLYGIWAILYCPYYISSLLLVQIRLFYITASTAPTIKSLFNAVFASSQVTRHFQHCFRLFFVFTWPLWTLVRFKLYSQKVKIFWIWKKYCPCRKIGRRFEPPTHYVGGDIGGNDSLSKTAKIELYCTVAGWLVRRPLSYKSLYLKWLEYP